MAQHNYSASVKILGIPDRLVEHGTLKELYKECEYDAASIAMAVRKMGKMVIDINTLTSTLD